MTATKLTTVAIIIGLGLAHLSWRVPATTLAAGSPRTGTGERHQIEKKAMAYTASDAFRAVYRDQRCHDRSGYRVYLIDNFEQRFHLVPEVLTTHGDMLARLLKAGRKDIEVRILNTALSKGLAQVIGDLADGNCVDAVVSAVPGSNYTYAQISSLLRDRGPITAQNILYHRAALRRLLRRIARHGFPSVEWLRNIDVNAVKLRQDARKFLFIEALGRFHVPVILPYGNLDARHKGRIRSVNLLSLASNAMVYSALDRSGARLEGFPYSPLSSGDAPAEYTIVECPHPEDPFKAVLDIDEDNRRDYTFFRVGCIAHRDERGQLAFAPPVTRQDAFARWLRMAAKHPEARFAEEMVLTAEQYRLLKRRFPTTFDGKATRSYVWLNSLRHGRFYTFDPACWRRGSISGTSVIPPHKVKELLPPKMGIRSGGKTSPPPGTTDG